MVKVNNYINLKNSIKARFGRRGTPVLSRTISPVTTLTPPSPWLRALGIVDTRTFDPLTTWSRTPAGDRLMIPIGPVHVPAEHLTKLRRILAPLRERVLGVPPLPVRRVVALDLNRHPLGLVQDASHGGLASMVRSLVVGLCARYSPAEVSLVLLDFRGGSWLDTVTGLPHVRTSVVGSEPDPTSLESALSDIKKEITRRLRMSEANLSKQPWIVVVAHQVPDTVSQKSTLHTALTNIATRGPRTKVAMILSSTHVDPALGALIAASDFAITARATAQESTTVLGIPAATSISMRPGRAVVRLGRIGAAPTLDTVDMFTYEGEQRSLAARIAESGYVAPTAKRGRRTR